MTDFTTISKNDINFLVDSNETLFIVDNIDKYNGIQQELTSKEVFPNLELTENHVACLRKSEDGFSVTYVDISHKNGYKAIGNMIIEITKS